VPVLEKNGDIYLDPLRFFDAVDAAISEVCNKIRLADNESTIRLTFDAYWKQKESEQAKNSEAIEPFPETSGTSGIARRD